MATTSTTATPTTTPFLPKSSPFGNQFELHDPENQTQIVYKLQKGGPIVVGATATGPVLQYTGAEGSLTFEGQQILQENTALGTLLTVTLNIVPDLRTLTFSMLMPEVIKAGSGGVGASQTFDTVGFKTQHHTSLVGALPSGGNPTYAAMKLHGVARLVEVAD